MAYDPDLANRIRELIADEADVTEKQMFGGLAFLVHGNMACGVRGDDLMVRMAPEGAAAALEEPDTRPFTMGGRTSKGWVLVAPAGHAGNHDLRRWVARGLDYAGSLPPKA